MKNKTFIAVVVSTLVLIVLTISYVGEREQAQLGKDDSGQVFFPQLGKAINDVVTVEVNQGGTTATLMRDGDQWRVKENGGYPADISRLRQTLMSLADLKTIEEKTRKPENYQRLGVEDPSPSGNSKQITVKDTKGSVLASVIIGNSKPAAGEKPGLYARKADDEQVWLLEGHVSIPFRAVEWLDKSIMDINQTSIKQVTITQPDKKKLVIAKESRSDAEFKVQGLAKGKSVKSPGDINNIAAALSGLNLEDVMAKEAFTFSPKGTVTARVETFDGLIVTASLMEKDGQQYAQFVATFDDKAVATPQPASENTQESFNVVGAASQQAAMLNQKLQPWVYVIPGFKVNPLKTRREDIIE